MAETSPEPEPGEYCLFNYICPFMTWVRNKKKCNLLFKGGQAKKRKMAEKSPEPDILLI
jgi:hypothetical protein